MSKPRRSPARARIAAWTRLALGLVILWAVVFRVGPWLQGYAPIGAFHASVETRGIDATALFYTDSEAFADVPLTMRNALRR